MRESTILRAVRLHLGQKEDLVIWRNNCGQYDDGHGNWVRYGVGSPGGSDLLGILNPTGRWFAVECKASRGRLSPEQVLFIDLVNRSGGYACSVRNVSEAEAHYQRARRGLSAEG